MDLRVSKSVRRIVVIHSDRGEKWQVETIYQKKGPKKKKGTRLLRPLEKRVRLSCEANRSALETYEKRHKKSNRKRRDGWLRDLNYNLYRAAAKKAKILNRPPILTYSLSRAVAKKIKPLTMPSKWCR